MSRRTSTSAHASATQARGRTVGPRLDLLAQAVASAAHDLSTATTRLVLWLELLEELVQDPGGMDVASVREAVAGVRAATTSLSGQIVSLQDLAQVAGGSVILPHRERFDLVALLRGACDELRSLTRREHRVRLEARVPALEGHWDRRLIERVVANLLSNASKYSSPDTEILLSAWRKLGTDGDWAAFAVQDLGIGIPEPDLPDVFTPYQRAGNVGDIPGQGIGLASVRQFVLLHGGRIDIQSEVGSGTTVTVHLPLSTVTPDHATARGPHLCGAERSMYGHETGAIDDTPTGAVGL